MDEPLEVAADLVLRAGVVEPDDGPAGQVRAKPHIFEMSQVSEAVEPGEVNRAVRDVVEARRGQHFDG